MKALMKTKMTRAALAVALSVGLSANVFAQDTSSAMRGTILGPTGSPAAGTVVKITHVPSGTVKTATVNDAGIFSAVGLRVGGPYTVELDSPTLQDKTLENIFITLGDTFRISESLEDQSMESIVVTGAKVYDFGAGSSSTFGSDQISKSASASRDLKDIARLNPMVVISPDGQKMSMAGSNPRYNSLQVDGVNLNDDFGLAGNGYPTERSPIAFDSVEQISVSVAPFSVKEAGFSGGQLSVVTKSGTNDFTGSIFFEKAQDSWAGTPENPSTGDDIELSFEEETWGFTLGGPILKDKLFFFASYETFESPSAVDKGPAGSGLANEVSNVTISDVERVQAAAQTLYGFDAGSWDASIPLEDEKYSLKLDWNINDDHRATFTYGYGFSNSAGNAGSGGGSELYLSSHWYNRSNEYDTYVAQLFSAWTDNFSTDAKISYKESVNGQVPLAGYGFGEVKIFNVGPNSQGTINIGPDDSRHANSLTNETLQVRLSGEYLMDSHVLSFGWEYEEVEVFNLFMQHNLGSWYYDSLEDFENQNAAEFEYQNNPSLNSSDAAASLTTSNHAFYIEDSWDVSYDFNVTYGLRYERIANDDSPNLNQLFVERHGFANTENLDGKDLIMPRVSFTWDVNDDVVIRGGAGKFSGGRPNVWVSNSYTNDGSRIALYSTEEEAFLAAADPRGIPQEALDFIGSQSLDGANSNIDAIDPNFEIPYSWQYSIAADFTADLSKLGLGEDWYFSTEILYKDNQEDVYWSDLSRKVDTTQGINGYTVDGRPIYGYAFDVNNDPYDPDAGVDGRFARDVLMKNIDGGTSRIFSLSAAKQWDNGIDMSFSYANQDIEDRISGSGTTTNTSYEFIPNVDPENPALGTSSYETEHRWTLSLSYTKEYFEGYATSFNVFWERKSGTPYSWILEKDGRADQFDSRATGGDLDLNAAYLPYIPTGPNDPAVDFVNGASYDEIIARVEAAGLSSSGGVLGKNASRSPWISTADLRIEQELPGFMEGHKGALYVDIKNFLNIFDENAGEIYTNRFENSDADLLGYEINAAGQYVYDIDSDVPPYQFQARESTWVAKIGIKYSF